MKILIATIDENIFLLKYYKKIFEKNHTKINGVIIFPIKNKKISFFDFVRIQIKILGLYDFIKVGILILKNYIIKFMPSNEIITIKNLAKKYNIETYNFSSINSDEVLKLINKEKIDLVVCSINEIIKKEIFDNSRAIFINRHFGLLPKYKGVWPLYWALKNKEKKCGITFHTMTSEIDGGDIIKQKEVEIKKGDTYLSLTKKCFDMSYSMLNEIINDYESGNMSLIKQDNLKSTYFTHP